MCTYFIRASQSRTRWRSSSDTSADALGALMALHRATASPSGGRNRSSRPCDVERYMPDASLCSPLPRGRPAPRPVSRVPCIGDEVWFVAHGAPPVGVEWRMQDQHVWLDKSGFAGQMRQPGQDLARSATAFAVPESS